MVWISLKPTAKVQAFELDRLCSAFVTGGVCKLCLAGGESLVRHDIMALFNSLSRHLRSGELDELTVTTTSSTAAISVRQSPAV